jgi:hypothetical protein
MSERQEQKRTLLMLSERFAPVGLFWTCDVGTAVPFSAFRTLPKRILDAYKRGGIGAVIETINRLRVITYGIEGGPDIQGSLLGRWVGVEMKAPGGRQRQSQKLFQRAIERAGGAYVIAFSAEEAVEKLIQAIAPTAHERLALIAKIAAARPAR